MPAAACALAALGVPVLLRLQIDLPTARHGLSRGAGGLGVDCARPLDAARAQRGLERLRSACSICRVYCRRARSAGRAAAAVGVRTVAQTLMKLVDPLHCSTRARRRVPRALSAVDGAGAGELGRAGLCVAGARRVARGSAGQDRAGVPRRWRAADARFARARRRNVAPADAQAATPRATVRDARTTPSPKIAPRSTEHRGRWRAPPPALRSSCMPRATSIRSPPPPMPRRVLASGEARAVAARLGEL